jgi:hypothetical protein
MIGPDPGAIRPEIFRIASAQDGDVNLRDLCAPERSDLFVRTSVQGVDVSRQSVVTKSLQALERERSVGREIYKLLIFR